MLLPPSQVQTDVFKHFILSPKSSRMSFSTSEDVEFSSDDTSDPDFSLIFSPLFFFSGQITLHFFCVIYKLSF